VICHRGRPNASVAVLGRTIAVSPRAVARHLSHGDTCGECPSSDKVVMCHRGKKTIVVSPKAEQKHAAHGDAYGACDAQLCGGSPE